MSISVYLLQTVNIGSTSIKYEHFLCDNHGNYQQLYSNTGVTLPVNVVVYRLVHFGDVFADVPCITMDQLTEDVEARLSHWAPLHNPHVFEHARKCADQYKSANVFFVSDSYFHNSIPLASKLLPLPAHIRDAGIRVYGFHGFAYMSVLDLWQNTTNNRTPNLVCIHLGGGCSVCCIERGSSIDTTMSVTPTSGLMMGSRCGNVDIMIRDLIDIDANTLNQHSGLLGICGTQRVDEALKKAASGDTMAYVALKMFTQRIVDVIATYYVRLHGKIDGIVFSGGISEWTPEIVTCICKSLTCLSVCTHEHVKRSDMTSDLSFVNSTSSKYPVAIARINEGLEMVKVAMSHIVGTLDVDVGSLSNSVNTL